MADSSADRKKEGAVDTSTEQQTDKDEKKGAVHFLMMIYWVEFWNKLLHLTVSGESIWRPSLALCCISRFRLSIGEE